MSIVVKLNLIVFPTPVGVFPAHNPIGLPAYGLPHARGGVSFKPPNAFPTVSSSPRPWGCFQPTFDRWLGIEVFPTPVGVFLLVVRHVVVHICLPHARGGVSSAWRIL